MNNHKLLLAKTHDFCAASEPALTVVMIHGIAANSSSFDKALQYLEGTTALKSVRFITFDLLGAGQSPSGDDLNYDYKDQLTALHNSIEELKLTTPLVLVGHSMGTFIVTRYAHTYKKAVQALILISPPVYTREDIESPTFKVAIKLFEQTLSARNPQVVNEKSFINEMQKIVMDKFNYKILSELTTPATLIYGDEDAVIASFNIPTVLAANPKYLTAIKTSGQHGVTRDKYTKIVPILEKILHGEKLTNTVAKND